MTKNKVSGKKDARNKQIKSKILFQSANNIFWHHSNKKNYWYTIEYRHSKTDVRSFAKIENEFIKLICKNEKTLLGD